MAREPSYPKDAPVGETEGHPGLPEEQKSEPAETRDRAERKEGAGRAKQLMTGAAIGIGSAALVAALLYASRTRKNDKDSGGR